MKALHLQDSLLPKYAWRWLLPPWRAAVACQHQQDPASATWCRVLLHETPAQEQGCRYFCLHQSIPGPSDRSAATSPKDAGCSHWNALENMGSCLCELLLCIPSGKMRPKLFFCPTNEQSKLLSRFNDCKQNKYSLNMFSNFKKLCRMCRTVKYPWRREAGKKISPEESGKDCHATGPTQHRNSTSTSGQNSFAGTEERWTLHKHSAIV